MAFLILLKPGSEPRTFPLDKATTTIGRRPTNDIILEDPFVSRAHAEVTRQEDGSCEVSDVGGKWPVRVNERLVSRHRLQDGDRIQIGGCTLVFRQETARLTPQVEFSSAAGSAEEPFEAVSLDARQTLLFSAESAVSGDLPQLQKDHQRLMLLYNLGRDIHSHLEDTSAVLAEVMNMAMKTLDAERGFIALHQESTGELECEIVRDQAADRDAAGFVVSRTILNKVMKEGVSVLTENALQDIRFGEAKSVQEFEIRSAVCVPLMTRDKTMGVIYLDNRTSVGSFSRDDLVFLNALGQLAGIALGNAALHRQVVQENQRLAEALKPRFLLGASASMENVYTMIKKAAPSQVTVLLAGETGTGKELAARAIHDISKRREKPFVAVNCAAIPKELIESELFGYEKGAFTGAANAADGKFRAADGGTVFLDEVADMSLDTQAKVLRVLEQREFQRVGGTQTFTVDVRVIAATNKDLKRAVEEGRFREDLYYRLNVVSIELPPLRERRDDILPLADHFIADRGPKISPKAAALLQSYGWPGNIRELRNCIDRAVVLGDGEVIQPEDLPPNIRNQKGQVPAPAGSLEHLERESIWRTLKNTKWRKSEAARLLGISRQTLDNKIKKYKIRK
jgi:Nif-specific regulatory protein